MLTVQRLSNDRLLHRLFWSRPRGSANVPQKRAGLMSTVSNLRSATRVFGVRNLDGGLFLERFLVSGVATIVLLRFYLEITGYPQVGGGGLHIAHMLWGGLLMLVAIVMLLA